MGCGDSTRFACPRNDAACKFNRKIKGKWFCVHHEQSPQCESARDDIKIRGLTEEEEERDLALLGTTSDRVDRFDRCWFHGKCDDSTRFACPRNDATCKFNRKIKGKWFCVHHEQSPQCESARDDIKIRGLTEEEEERDLALLGTTSDRVDGFDRCWFHGKCDDSNRFACPRNDSTCNFNRKIKGKSFCVYHEQADKCVSARDEIKIRGLTEEEERDLALLGTTSDRVDRFDRCWF